MQSSLFKFATIDQQGRVNNTIYGATGSAANFKCQSYRVVPAFPLITATLLKVGLCGATLGAPRAVQPPPPLVACVLHANLPRGLPFPNSARAQLLVPG
jgi:hypothetical protein